ncbi:hypothetical protein THTE_0332 [Thermogutta terrifontis]|uniref:Uncharacterized protein n=1 Tax=Thermogutta terrifontis TaxID=1331910 RepID=A0A286RAD0_9BACT|nr:hypothetical protein THTE_0332 [Thermogutta terrifontis]
MWGRFMNRPKIPSSVPNGMSVGHVGDVFGLVAPGTLMVG